AQRTVEAIERTGIAHISGKRAGGADPQQGRDDCAPVQPAPMRPRPARREAVQGAQPEHEQQREQRPADLEQQRIGNIDRRDRLRRRQQHHYDNSQKNEEDAADCHDQRDKLEPELEAGNMLAKSLSFVPGAKAALLGSIKDDVERGYEAGGRPLRGPQHEAEADRETDPEAEISAGTPMTAAGLAFSSDYPPATACSGSFRS